MRHFLFQPLEPTLGRRLSAKNMRIQGSPVRINGTRKDIEARQAQWTGNGSPQPHPGSVRWGFAPVGFELVAHDEELLDQAARIFRPWQECPFTEPSCRWLVEALTPVDGLPEYRLQFESATIHEVLRCDDRDYVLLIMEAQAVQAVLAERARLLDLHGALVSKDGQGVLIIGASFSGKSTLACALWQAGWSLLGDDTTLLDAETSMARSVPRRVNLRAESHAFFDKDLWDRIESTPSCSRNGNGWRFHPHEIEAHPRPASAGLSAIVFLDRRGAAVQPGDLLPIPPSHGLMAILSYCTLTQGLVLGEALRHFRPLVETVPMYDLGRASLPTMVDLIGTLVEESEPNTAGV